MLSKSAWPGNIRELENVIERAVILCMSSYVSVEDLLPSLTACFEKSRTAPREILLAGRSLEDIESQAICETLEQTGGNKTEAAKVLNITRTTLNNKIKKYNIADLSGNGES